MCLLCCVVIKSFWWSIKTFKKTILSRVAAIAPWFCLLLPSCSPGFESQAHHLCFFQFVLLKLYRENKENKQKEAGICPFFKTFWVKPNFHVLTRIGRYCLSYIIILIQLQLSFLLSEEVYANMQFFLSENSLLRRQQQKGGKWWHNFFSYPFHPKNNLTLSLKKCHQEVRIHSKKHSGRQIKLCNNSWFRWAFGVHIAKTFTNLLKDPLSSPFLTSYSFEVFPYIYIGRSLYQPTS